MITRLLQAGIMGAWATFFTWLFAVEQPTLARLLHPRLWWLVLAGAVVLLIFLGVALRTVRNWDRGRTRRAVGGGATHAPVPLRRAGRDFHAVG